MSTQPENLAGPGFPAGRTKKRKRRSSILKPASSARPLEEIQNVAHMDEKTLKDRRVSFCHTIEIKEFLKELPTQLGLPVHSSSGEASEASTAPFGKVRKAELPPEEGTFIQISTPKARKRRRISSHLGTSITRLSIIPNLEKSFVIGDEEDFEAYTDDLEEENAATTALPEEITLKDVDPEPIHDMNMNDFCDAEVPATKCPCDLPCPEPPTLSASSNPTPVSSVHSSVGEVCWLFDSQPPSLIPNKDSSDMELTLIESALNETHTHECTSLFSPDELLKVIRVANTNSSTCSQPDIKVNTPTSKEPTTEPTSAMDFTCMEAGRPSTDHAASPDLKAASATSLSVDTGLMTMSKTLQHTSTNREPTTEPTSTMDLTCFEGGRPSTDDTTSLDLKASATSLSVDMGLNLTMSETLHPSSRHITKTKGSTHDNLTSFSAGCEAATSQLHPTTMPHLQADTDVQLTRYQICTKGNTRIEEVTSSDTSEERTSLEKLQLMGNPSADGKVVATCHMYPSTILPCSHTRTELDIDEQLTTYQSCAMNMTCVEETEVVTSPETQQTDFQNVKTSDLTVTASNEPETTPHMSAFSTATVSHGSITQGTHSTAIPTTAVEPLKPHSYQPSYSKANQSQSSRPLSKPLVVASPFIRTLKCTPSFLPPQGSGLPTSLGLPSTLIRNNPGCSNKVSHISLPITQLPYHTAPASTITNSGWTPTSGTVRCSDPVAEVKPLPSSTIDNDGPHEAEHSHPGVTSLENSLPRIDTTTDTNWLQTTVDGSFSLIGSSPESNHSPTAENGTTSSNLPGISSQVVGPLKNVLSSPHLNETYKLSRPLLNAQALTAVHHHESYPSNQEISLLRKTVDKLKVNTEQAGNDTVCIKTPEIVPLEQITDLQKAFLDSSSHLGCSTADVAHQTVSESVLMQQSLLMSPSAFSKFLTALKCNKSMSFYVQTPSGNGTPEKPPLGVSRNIFNTTATPLGHNLGTSSSYDKGDFSAMNETNGEIVTNTPQQTNDHEPPIVASQSPDREGPSSSPSMQPSTNSTCSKVSQLCREHQSPMLFSDHLKELHARLIVAVNGLRLRLRDAQYLSAHPRLDKGLLHWYNAAHAGLCGIHTLMAFGKLSGLSISYCWDATAVPNPLPFPPSWEDDITGDTMQKAKWLEELHTTMLQVHSTAEYALREAASIYHWHLERWAEREIEVSIQSKFKLKFELEPREDCIDNMCIQKIRTVQIHSVEGYKPTSKQKGLIANLLTTANIAQVLYTLSTEEP